ALRSEARNLMARRGNLCSASTCRMISPTAPVAPTTATLGTTKEALSSRRNRPSRSKGETTQQTILRPGARHDKGHVAEVARLRATSLHPNSGEFGYERA